MISVLLPTYNSVNNLLISIECILNQSLKEFELLILDDGSIDETEKNITRIADERIRYHKLSHKGLADTLNYGLSIAKYDIIARMDADDLCVPRRLEKQLTQLSILPENTLLSSWYGVFTHRTLLYVVSPTNESTSIKKGLLLHSYISHPGLMYRKNVLLRYGGYITSNAEKAFEDYETWLAIKDKVEFAIIPEVLVYQRYRKESLSNNLEYKQKIMYAIQEPYYKDLKNTFNITDTSEENIYRGWREYFYGNKSLARKYWYQLGSLIYSQPRIIIAWIMTYLPEQYFILIKEYRLRYRLSYYTRYFSKGMKAMRQQFKSMC
jgi:glycosyltransferase involved in cell wall biosynthesis